MLVRLVRFSLAPGKQAAAQALADDLAPQIRALKGCHGVHVFGDEADGEYGLFVLWDSQADADAAAGVIGPQLTAHLAGNAKSPPDIRLFEVLSD
jgi:quinol monooxygenase YgiN